MKIFEFEKTRNFCFLQRKKYPPPNGTIASGTLSNAKSCINYWSLIYFQIISIIRKKLFQTHTYNKYVSVHMYCYSWKFFSCKSNRNSVEFRNMCNAHRLLTQWRQRGNIPPGEHPSSSRNRKNVVENYIIFQGCIKWQISNQKLNG